MRIGVTASRDWTDGYTMLFDLVDTYYEVRWEYIRRGLDCGPVTLIEGEAEGGDLLSASIAHSLGWTVEPYPIKSWYKDGKFNKLAGFERNQEMVNSGADIWMAFMMPCSKPNCRITEPHESHGATDCANRAESAGIPTKRYRKNAQANKQY